MEHSNRDFDETKSLQPVGPNNQQTIATEQEPASRQNWPMLLALTIAALAFAILVVFGGRFIYHKLHHPLNPAPASSSSLPKSFSSSSAPTSGSVTKPGSSSSSTNQQLANSGPGDVVAIFVASSFAAASLHFIVSLRKQPRA